MLSNIEIREKYIISLYLIHKCLYNNTCNCGEPV